MRDWKRFCKKENWHDAANLFPLMDGGEIVSLVQDIKEHGLQNPIVLFQGKVLDGRNRVLACATAGVKPKFANWRADGVSPLDFVIAQNLERRHLTTDQRAALGAKLVPRLAEEAKRRQRAAGKHGKEGGRGNKKPSAQGRAEGLGKSAAQAASLIGGVSTRYVEFVVSLEKKKAGTLDRIINGEVTVNKARKEINGTLADRFGAPPFSVLHVNAPYWKKRRRYWLSVFGMEEDKDTKLREAAEAAYNRCDEGWVVELDWEESKQELLQKIAEVKKADAKRSLQERLYRKERSRE